MDAAKGFYADVLGLQPVMDHGWIVTLADPDPASTRSLARGFFVGVDRANDA